MARKRKDYREYTVSGMGSTYGNSRMKPTLRIQGLWLEELGFNIGDSVKVKCEDGKLIITRDQDRMDQKEAERMFMDQEMKLLHERFEREKDELVAIVAEARRPYNQKAEA